MHSQNGEKEIGVSLVLVWKLAEIARQSSVSRSLVVSAGQHACWSLPPFRWHLAYWWHADFFITFCECIAYLWLWAHCCIHGLHSRCRRPLSLVVICALGSPKTFSSGDATFMKIVLSYIFIFHLVFLGGHSSAMVLYFSLGHKTQQVFPQSPWLKGILTLKSWGMSVILCTLWVTDFSDLCVQLVVSKGYKREIEILNPRCFCRLIWTITCFME